MRNFSIDANGKLINLWNIERRRFIPNVGLKGQCARDYFYGKAPDLERAIGSLEAAAAPVLRTAMKQGVFPSRDEEAHLRILEFLAIQIGRTTAAERNIDQMTDALAKFLLSGHKELASTLSDITISYEDSVLLSLQGALLNYPILSDLGIKMFVPRHGCEFLLSDNPAICFNPFFHQRGQRFENGLANRGLQIFLPIGPKNALFLFDYAIYRVAHPEAPTIRLPAIDVTELNALQYTNAVENIYFRSPESLPKIEVIDERYRDRCISEVSNLQVVHKERHSNGTREIVQVSTKRPDFVPKLRSVSIRRTIPEYLSPGVRNPDLVRAVRAFANEMQRKKMG